jgi:hypothetical protein
LISCFPSIRLKASASSPFILTILVPGFLLAIFGVRALLQERRLAEQQLHNRLEHSAELTTRALADQFSKLQRLVDDGLKYERALDSPVGSWAYVESDGSNLRVLQENVLPYELSATAPLGKAQPPSTAETKHQLACALQKSGNTSDAETGTKSVVLAEGVARAAAANPTFSPDGKYLYYESPATDPASPVLMRLDVASGQKQEVFRPNTGYLRLYALSPDGSQIVFNWRKESDLLYVLPATGGEPKLLYEYPKVNTRVPGVALENLFPTPRVSR